MQRIYHPYHLWEDYKAGFYDNLSGKNKDALVEKVIELFSSKELTEQFMKRVTSEWIYSCEHNLSNISLNRIAYIGQGACCVFAGVPSDITMFAWSKVKKENRDEADKIALSVLNDWENLHKNKQLCLKFI